jgi:hypothetical protein
MDILAICRFFALPAVIILALIVVGQQKRYGNHPGPVNPTPIPTGRINIDPHRKVNK